MNQHLLFLLLGLGAGATYALLGLGLVLEHRSAGVLNLAHGAIAMYTTFVFAELRDSGDLLLPVVGVPARLSLSGPGLGATASFAITLVYAAVFGLLVHLVVFRPLQKAPALARLVASVGLMVALQAAVVLNLGSGATTSRRIASILPSAPVDVFGVAVPSNRFWVAGIAVMVTVVLWAVYRFSRFGLATRAAAESERGAALMGLSANGLGAANWMLATMLAAASGILIAPISRLDATAFTLFIIPSLAAALVGGLRSYWVTLVAGLTIGMLQSEATKLQLDVGWLPDRGLQEVVPLLAIVVALVLYGRRLPLRVALHTSRLPRVTDVRHPVLAPAVSGAIGVMAAVALTGDARLALVQSLTMAVLAMSIVVVTGYAGQASLAQLAVAGMAAFTLSVLAADHGVPFPLAPLLAAAAVIPVGILLGLPALRTRGVHLAVMTLAAAMAVDALVFGNASVAGGLAGRQVPEPALLGVDLGIRGTGTGFPRVAYAVLVVVVTVLVGVLVRNLRRSPTGRRLLAVRGNERAASAVGIAVGPSKLYAFAVSSFVAGIAGCLIGYQSGVVSGGQFHVLGSLLVVALAYLGGIGSVAGAVVAGALFAPGGIGSLLLDRTVDADGYLPVIGGIGVVVVAVLWPDGLVPAVESRHGDRLAHVGPPSTSTLPSPSTSPSPPIGGNGSVESLAEPSILWVEGLSVNYGGVVAVAGADLAVSRGEVVGLIGPNGAGKTSLVDAVAGYAPAAGGQVRLAGVDISHRAPYRIARLGLARTFQSLELVGDLTVAENVALPSEGRPRGRGLRDLVAPGRGPAAAAQRELARFGLERIADRCPDELAHGERALVSLARALAAAPTLLVLDEPAAGLDAGESRALGRTLRGLAGGGLSTLLVEHDIELVLGLCDRVYVMDAGRIIAVGTPDQVRSNPQVVEAYLGEDADSDELLMGMPS